MGTLRHGIGRRAALTACAFATTLSGCASKLPAPEADAFAKLATADKGAFGDLADRERASNLAFSQSLARENIGRVVVSGCESDAKDDCVLTYTVPDRQPAPTASPTHARALIGAVARYSDQMSLLAQAKDLDDLKAKTSAAGGSLKALAALAAPGIGLIATPIVDAAVAIGDAGFRAKRRRAMLKVAEEAQPVIDSVVATLGVEAVSFRAVISKGSADAILMTQKAVLENQSRETALLAGRPPAQLSYRRRLDLEALRDRRAADLMTLDQQAQALTQARRLPVDYTSLSKAHAALVAELRDPKVTMADAVAEVDQFLTVLDEVKAAGGGK